MAEAGRSSSSHPRRRDFQSELIKIIVGPTEQIYEIHRDVLCRDSVFFQRCLTVNMRESSTKTIKFPEEQQRVFEEVVQWLYGMSIKAPSNNASEEILSMISMYELADKWGIEPLMNELSDSVKIWLKTNMTDCLFLCKIPESPLRKLFIDGLAWDLTERDLLNQVGLSNSAKELLAEGGDLVMSVLNSIARITKITAKKEKKRDYAYLSVAAYGKLEPWSRPTCEYHKHVATKKCKKQDTLADVKVGFGGKTKA